MAGDEAVFHFAGHGEASGVTGIRYGTYPYAEMMTAAGALTGRGVGVRMVLDCCNSGGAADRVREEFFQAEASMRSPSAYQWAPLCSPSTPSTTDST